MKLFWDEKAKREIRKLELPVARRIAKAIRELGEDPSAKDVKKLQGSGSFRLRVGDYRVIFDMEGENILILKIGHRENIYKR